MEYPLDVAIKYFGSQSALANALGVSRQAAGQWRPNIPKLRIYQLEEITAGRLNRRNLKAIK